VVNGAPQQPIDGTSLAYTFSAANAPERHTTQYFEMMGNRAIYDNGWLASTTPINAPWNPLKGVATPADYKWELYDLTRDFAQTHDLAARQPRKLAQMQALFDTEAKRNNVYPLDDRMKMERFLAAAAMVPKRSRYTYWGAGISTPVLLAAPLVTRSFRITADIDTAQPAQTAPILAAGSKFGGWSFYLDNGRPVALVAASHLARDQHRVSAAEPVKAGATKLVFDFHYDGGINAGGEMIVSANGTEIARGRLPATFTKYPEMTDTLDIGLDADTPVTAAYPLGTAFAGTIARVDVEVGPAGKPGAAPVSANAGQ
jgi:arylsulfatase